MDEVPAGPETVRVSAGPPGVRRSWAELITCLHGGLAIIDEHSRVALASDGFLSSTGLDPDDVIDRDIRHVFPNLGKDDPRPLLDRVAHGQLLGIGQSVRGSDGALRWVRITVIASNDLGEGFPAVVFVQDTTPTSHAMSVRRQATLRVTDVEDLEHLRLRRELHDGPIQLLAALSLRLSLVDDSDTARELRRMVAEVTTEFREILVELSSDDDERSAGSALEQWIAPSLVGSPLTMAIEDHLTTAPNRALTQAAFVFLYELVRATRDQSVQRKQRVSLDSERGGYRLIFTTTTSGRNSSVIEGPARAQFRAMDEYARSLGGSMATELSDEGIRTFSVWLPADAESSFDADEHIVAFRDRTELHRAEWVRSAMSAPPDELSDRAWEEIVRAAPEPITEFDSGLTFALANRAYEDIEGATEAEIVGGPPLSARFTPEDVEDLLPELTKVRAGEDRVFEWNRINANGVRRFVGITATPRVDPDGEFGGALTAIEDLSDLVFLEQLQASALADLQRAGRQTQQASVERMHGPIAGLRHVLLRLPELERVTPNAEPLGAIRDALDEAIDNINRSVDLLAVPDLADGDIGGAVRRSLTSVLGEAEVEVTYTDQLGEPLRPEHADLLFRIAREAVVNAVLHGSARRVDITLAELDGGLLFEIHNDGESIDLRSLETQHDHLGLRLMMERARAQSGTCSIQPAPQGGTLVAVVLPRTSPTDPAVR